MGISRDLQILELSGLHLDRSLTGCGDATVDELRVAVEARLIALRQAFQAAIDRRVELVVLHSEVLTAASTAGRAPWFLARQIEACGERGIPIVWIERQHNDWMARFVDTPSDLTRMHPGEVRLIETSSGPVQVVAGLPTPAERARLAQRREVVIGWDVRSDRELLDLCDLDLVPQNSVTDRVDDPGTEPRVTLHTLKPQKANSAAALNVWPIGQISVACGVAATVPSGRRAEYLAEEIDSAAGQYFATHPQAQLLLVDLTITGPGEADHRLWDHDQRDQLRQELTRRSRHPGCRVRSVTARFASSESDSKYVPLIESIWSLKTELAGRAAHSLAELASESVTAPDWARSQRVAPDHTQSVEVRQAVLQRLRSAS